MLSSGIVLSLITFAADLRHGLLDHGLVRRKKRRRSMMPNFLTKLIHLATSLPVNGFARFRGLRSLRTSPWDPYENLPKDYGRAFALEDWRKVERAVKRRAFESTSPVSAGERVSIYLRDVSEADAFPLVEAATSGSSPTVLFGLFEHEHKMTVLNFTVQRNTEYDEPVKSKVFCCHSHKIHSSYLPATILILFY